MIKLKALSKLREFYPGQDVQKYLLTEHRQNLRAIERSFNDSLDGPSVYMQLSSLTVAASEEALVTYSNDFKIDSAGIESEGVFNINSDAVYAVDFNINAYSCVGSRSIDLNVYIGSSVTTYSIIHTNTTDQFTATASLSFPIRVYNGNKLFFKIYNYGTASSTTISSGLLKMTKLII